MTRLRRLIAIFLFAGFLVRPLPAAALPRILPKCDVATVYYVIKGETKEQSMSEEAYYKQAESVLKNNQVLRTVIDKNKNCGFDEFMQLFVNLANWGFAILAATALIFFLYGGFNLLIAGGRTEYVQRGKQVVVGTFLGSLVALVSWAAINTVYTALNVNSKYELQGGRGGGSGLAACRKSSNWPKNCGSELKYKCADPHNVPEGNVTKLQRRLANKCPECLLQTDGCFGDETARCLYAFKIANGLPVPGDYHSVTINVNDLALISDERTKSCYGEDVQYLIPEPPNADRDISLPPLQTQPGCCVPRSGNFPCIDVEVREACPYDVPLEPGAPPAPSYGFWPGACQNVAQCQPGCCLIYHPNIPANCRDVGTAAQCLPGESFSSGDCDTIDLCTRAP